MAIIKNRVFRVVLFSLGVFSLGLGFMGLFLPLLPTTPFLLLAAWCFLKSSEKAHQWIYNQRILGPILRDWEESKSIRRSTKIVAIAMILASVFYIWIKVEPLWIKGSVTILLTVVSTFILTRKERGS